MKSFQSLQEERGEKAFKQAIAMGLKYSGFGYWKDPQSGETKFKTENDTLVPVEQEVSAELADKGGPGDPSGERGQMDGMPGGGMGGGMMNAAGMLQMPGGQQVPGENIGPAPEPGEEQAPKEKGWKAGPDGDTCVGPEAEDPAKLPKDTFVGTTNYMRWTAGPDGSNMTTVNKKDLMPEGVSSFRQMMQEGNFLTEESAAEEAYGYPYTPDRGRDVVYPEKPLGFQVERALADDNGLASLFKGGQHERLGGDDQKTDIRSTIGDDTVNTSVKAHAGWDDDWSTQNFYNTSTAHNPQDSIRYLLGVHNNEELSGVIDLFDNENFKANDSVGDDRRGITKLLEHLNANKGDIFHKTLRGFHGEDPVEQIILYSMKKGYNGKDHNNQPENNPDHHWINGMLSGHDISEDKIREVLDKQEWHHDGGRNFYLGAGPRDATLALRMSRPWQHQNSHQMHINRSGFKKHFPKMWDASMVFKSGGKGNGAEPDRVKTGNFEVHNETPLLRKLMGRGDEGDTDVSSSSGSSRNPAPAAGAGGRVRGGGVVSRGIDPEALRRMNNPMDDQVHHSFETFLGEAPMPMGGGMDPKAEAEKQGLEFAGFGWYRDPQTGKRVAKIVGDKLVRYDQGQEMTPATTHTGNQTTVGFNSPADKARSMGLQSDGSGGYVDPSSGQVVARTVNNELVFYDAQGGAVSDGSGGEQLTQSSPSWVDPVSGLIVVPPAQPESPEEQAAAPDPIPALAPMGLDAFFNKRKIDMYRQQAAQDGAQADIDAQQMEVDEVMNMHPGMRELQRQMESAFQKAEESGNQTKASAGAIGREILNTEAGKLLKFMAFAKDDQVEEILKKIKTMIISRAKMEEMEGRDGYESPERSLSDEDYESYRESRRKRRVASEFLNNTHDENMGVPDAPQFKEGKDYPREISGNDVTYELKPYSLRSTVYANDARDTARENGLNMRNFRDAAVVEWNVDEDFDGNPRKAALEALSLWRKEILPTLPEGLVLMADPMETDKDIKDGRVSGQRERMYQMAGFGSTLSRGLIGAIVTKDEQGNSVLVPINPTEKQKRATQMESRYINLIAPDLNNQEIDVIYEMLFE